jgi:hypothetical protein
MIQALLQLAESVALSVPTVKKLAAGMPSATGRSASNRDPDCDRKARCTSIAIDAFPCPTTAYDSGFVATC